MSLFAILLTCLLSFPGFVVALIEAPGCLANWEWTYNSVGQDPCIIAAYMLSTCNDGSFIVPYVTPGHSYTGPNGPDDGDLCKCNTVAYTLISACAACQGAGSWLPWAEYKANCAEVLPPSTFPNPVPDGTSVPLWALLDITGEGTWDLAKAKATGDSPEAGPNTSLAPPAKGGNSSSVPSGTPLSSTSPAPSGPSAKGRPSSFGTPLSTTSAVPSALLFD